MGRRQAHGPVGRRGRCRRSLRRRRLRRRPGRGRVSYGRPGPVDRRALIRRRAGRRRGHGLRGRRRSRRARDGSRWRRGGRGGPVACAQRDRERDARPDEGQDRGEEGHARPEAHLLHAGVHHAPEPGGPAGPLAHDKARYRGISGFGGRRRKRSAGSSVRPAGWLAQWLRHFGPNGPSCLRPVEGRSPRRRRAARLRER